MMNWKRSPRPSGLTLAGSKVLHKVYTATEPIFTVCPPHKDERFVVGPDEPLTGGFSTTPVGIDPLTGKSW